MAELTIVSVVSKSSQEEGPGRPGRPGLDCMISLEIDVILIILFMMLIPTCLIRTHLSLYGRIA